MDKDANDCYIGNYDDDDDDDYYDESSDPLSLMSAMNSSQFDFYSKLPSSAVREPGYLDIST